MTLHSTWVPPSGNANANGRQPNAYRLRCADASLTPSTDGGSFKSGDPPTRPHSPRKKLSKRAESFFRRETLLQARVDGGIIPPSNSHNFPLVAVVSKSFVSISHSVCFFPLANGVSCLVGSIHQLISQFTSHSPAWT